MTKKGKILILVLVLVVCAVLVLGAICLGVGLVGAWIFLPDIPPQGNDADAALLEVLPEGQNFEKIEIDENYPATIMEGFRADGGYVFRAEVAGKGTGLIIMIGIDEQGKVTGTKVIASNETSSYSDNVFSAVEGPEGVYVGMDIYSFYTYIVSGATMTSQAYGEAVEAALWSVEIYEWLNGGVGK